jgi:hypothetical protein
MTYNYLGVQFTNPIFLLRHNLPCGSVKYYVDIEDMDMDDNKSIRLCPITQTSPC